MISLVRVDDERTRLAARELITDYLRWIAEGAASHYGLAIDVDAMVASDLGERSRFRPPDGRLYVLRDDDAHVGVGGLKRLDATIAEAQRMYVVPAARGASAGRLLMERLVADARSIGYSTIRLESLRFLAAAHALYRSVGFVEIEPYADNSMKHYQSGGALDTYRSSVVFMELRL